MKPENRPVVLVEDPIDDVWLKFLLAEKCRREIICHFFSVRACRVWVYMGPASIYQVALSATPVSVSLLAIADSIGEGPRYFIEEGWTLIFPV